MSMTYVTIALTGKHTAKGIANILNPMMRHARQAFGIVSNRNTQTKSRKDLPHAFVAFSTDPVCANDCEWNEQTLAAKEDKRLNLDQIRAFRLLLNDHIQEVESETKNT